MPRSQKKGVGFSQKIVPFILDISSHFPFPMPEKARKLSAPTFAAVLRHRVLIPEFLQSTRCWAV